MVACYEHNFCIRYGRKQIIYFLQFFHQRLPVKQIPCNQKQAGFFFAGLSYQSSETVPYFLASFFTPGKTLVRFCAQMYVSGMKKFHKFSFYDKQQVCTFPVQTIKNKL